PDPRAGRTPAVPTPPIRASPHARRAGRTASRSARSVPPGAEVASLARIQRAVDPLPRAEHLLDRSITDRMHTDLQPRPVRVVEEPRQLIVVVVRDPLVRIV